MIGIYSSSYSKSWLKFSKAHAGGNLRVSASVSVWFGQQNVLSRRRDIHANLVVEKRKVWIDYTIKIA